MRVSITLFLHLIGLLSAMTSGVNLGISSTALIFSCSCSTLVAPRMTLETPSCLVAHARESWLTLPPSRSALYDRHRASASDSEDAKEYAQLGKLLDLFDFSFASIRLELFGGTRQEVFVVVETRALRHAVIILSSQQSKSEWREDSIA